ncbi:M20 family metallo-hydrolase [Pseudodesulfovibrio pelocollis]|uniref:M20 family metallo-hydrolase n=1 Tax=Pseudodesulfovibrio pelocollis TaxID=3051432 RepID=UPI00255AA231|nr:M20 family metallo-hydrolase [Pseudodesulfovibrio sp. SB368]
MDALFAALDGQTETVYDLQRRLTAIPALGPKNGGDGEKQKAEFLMEYVKSMGIGDVREFRAPDDSVTCGYRPSVAAVIPGKDTSRTLWVISHTDIVPPGDLALWKTDPYILERDGDTLIGRGVEDNQQGIVSSLIAARVLLDQGVTPEINFGMLFVADEETGSIKGLDYLVREHTDIFSPNDLFLVPDFGEPDSGMIEVAEKSMFWLKIIIEGRQCHASTPGQGINTLVAAADFILRIRELERIYDAEDPIYDPPRSTFQPTKKEANVENVNTIPGRDVFYVDSRVLPIYDLDDVLETIKEFGREVENVHGVTVSYERTMYEQAAPATPVDSEIVQRTLASVVKVYGSTPRLVGVGGGTVAAFLRRRGFNAVVWATLNHNAHQPNEWSSIKNTIGDAKVIVDMLLARE